MIVAGLDLARRNDHSALVRLRSTVRWGWEVTHALRLQQIAYRAQLEALRPALAGVERLAVDAGGVGDPVMEMLDGELPEGLRLLPVLITGGESARIGGRRPLARAEVSPRLCPSRCDGHGPHDCRAQRRRP